MVVAATVLLLDLRHLMVVTVLQLLSLDMAAMLLHLVHPNIINITTSRLLTITLLHLIRAMVHPLHPLAVPSTWECLCHLHLPTCQLLPRRATIRLKTSNVCEKQPKDLAQTKAHSSLH